MWNRDYFGHDDPEGRYHMYYLSKFGYRCSTPNAENLLGTFYQADLTLRGNAKSMVDSWMGSNAHRRAILDGEYNVAGAGVFIFKNDNGDIAANALQLFCPGVSSTNE
jgi:uncharacterized protein YkwD